MRLDLFLAFLFSLAIVVASSTSDPSNETLDNQDTTTSPTSPGSGCAHQSEAVEFFRLYNPSAMDHFYTTSTTEADNAINNLGYLREQNAGRVFSTPTFGTVPLYRLYNTSISDNFYTISEAGVDYAVNVAGYTYNGIAGYVYGSSQCGAVPLYRLYSASATDHFYTTSLTERDSAINGGYTSEGIDGYILPE